MLSNSIRDLAFSRRIHVPHAYIYTLLPFYIPSVYIYICGGNDEIRDKSRNLLLPPSPRDRALARVQVRGFYQPSPPRSFLSGYAYVVVRV